MDIKNLYEVKLIEYQKLKEEIFKKIESCDNIATFTITSTIAIITIAISANNFNLFLVPFGIVFPMSMRMLHYKRGIIKIASYIIVFLEKSNDGLNWESYNYKMLEMNFHKSFCNYVRNSEFLILSILCSILYIMKSLSSDIAIHTVILYTLCISMILFETVLTYFYNNVYAEMNRFISQWEQLEIHINK